MEWNDYQDTAQSNECQLWTNPPGQMQSIVYLSLVTLAFPLVLPPLSLSTASFHSASSCLICSSTWYKQNRLRLRRWTGKITASMPNFLLVSLLKNSNVLFRIYIALKCFVFCRQHHLYSNICLNDFPLFFLDQLHLMPLVEVAQLIAGLPKIWG